MLQTDSSKDVPCAVCGTTVVRSDFVVCPQCDVPAHRDCWAHAGKCPIFGCAATESLEPALALFRSRRATAVAVPPAALPEPASGQLDALNRRYARFRARRGWHAIKSIAVFLVPVLMAFDLWWVPNSLVANLYLVIAAFVGSLAGGVVWVNQGQDAIEYRVLADRLKKISQARDAALLKEMEQRIDAALTESSDSARSGSTGSARDRSG